MSDLELLETQEALLDAFHSARPVNGLTHNFYRYPARMSPDLARYIVGHYSDRGDIVLDPFMGGGTTAVESLALGRRFTGIDINPLAHFVTKVKTTPLFRQDRERVSEWASMLQDFDFTRLVPITPEVEARTRNLPDSLRHFLELAYTTTQSLPKESQREFARCVLLRLGQWAVEVSKRIPEVDVLRLRLKQFTAQMLEGIEEFSRDVSAHGGSKRKTVRERSLIWGSALECETLWNMKNGGEKPTLILTSPPYPGVHVLYHRWQVYGRRETSTPYWLIGAVDGAGEGHYTLGGRSQKGLNLYFQSIAITFTAVRKILSPDGLVVQLVSFSDTEQQLPRYLDAMLAAGFSQVEAYAGAEPVLWRSVPGRKWYNRVRQAEMREALLVHVPVNH